MVERKGDPDKKPPECNERPGMGGGCPNLEETGGGFEGERYACAICGESYKLYYEDMA